MRRKVSGPSASAPPAAAPAAKTPTTSTVTLPHDAANEGVLVAASYLFPEVRSQLITRLVPDHFAQKEHRDVWTALQEASRRKLEPDHAFIAQTVGDVAASYISELSELKPELPKNIGYHITTLLWDHARLSAVRGPIPAFIEALRDPKAEPERVKGLARAVALAFDGYEDRKYLYAADSLVADQMRDVEERVMGRAAFSYGIEGLDFMDQIDFATKEPKRRMLPGPAPGQVTVVTGVSGGGKTTVTASMVIGIAFPGWKRNDFDAPGRTVLYGAWEMGAGVTIELLACISLGWSRSDLMAGKGPVATTQGRQQLRERMERLATRIRVMGNPFRRARGEKITNEKNLDLLQGYIADSACEVFVGDLWKRCLKDSAPEEEEEALLRQQAMVADMRVHGILLQQQRLKDIEMRPDKRPTREGIKGSSAWVEIADTILGCHRPALFKRCDDVTLEVIVLKQRYGKWPLVVEFGWDPDSGSISGGRHVEYERPGEANEVDAGAGLSAHYGSGKGRR